MKKILLLFCLMLSFASPGGSKTLNGGYPACMTKELYNQILSSIIQENNKELDYLLKNGCVMTRAGLEITLLNRDLNGVAKVRVFYGEKAWVMWTSSKNIKSRSQ